MGGGIIEKLGLVKRIEGLIADGTTTTQGIASALTVAGYPISQPTVSRYLKRTRDARREETQQIIANHVNARVPEDLDALEQMEATCLAWANEENASFAQRLAARHITAHMDRWVGLIVGAGQKEDSEAARKKAVAKIMQQCVGWVLDEFAIQKARLAAMKQATGIIEMKLRFSGLIGDRDGNVYILGSEDKLERDADSGRFFVIKGGDADG